MEEGACSGAIVRERKPRTREDMVVAGEEPREAVSGQTIKDLKGPVRKALDISLIPGRAAEDLEAGRTLILHLI